MELDITMKVSVTLEGAIDSSTENCIYVEHLNKKFSIDVPNNITKEDRLRLKGLGKQSADGRKGDLFLEFNEINNVGVHRTKHLFCIKCGQQLPEGANFCLNCGAVAKIKNNEQSNGRQAFYDGEIHKCPKCGETLNSFEVKCSSCGYELRGNKTANSIREFSEKLSQLCNDKQKLMLIRSFPIPNNKEDILEFIILASSNIDNKSESEVIDAWKVKFEQAYQKAKLLFENDDIFLKIQKIYADTYKKILKKEKAEKLKIVENIISKLTPIIPNLFVIIGWFLSIIIIIPNCGVDLDNIGFNKFPLLLILLLIVGVFLIPPFIKNESNIPRLITALGLILVIILLIPLCSRKPGDIGFIISRFILIVGIVCSIIIYVQIIQKKLSSHRFDKFSVAIALGFQALFIAVYLITSLIVFLSNKSEMINVSDEYKNTTEYSDENIFESIYDWTDGELSIYLPKPKSENGQIISNSNSYFKLYVYKISEDDYEAYVDACEEWGFIIESEEKSNSYKAYNVSGYKVSISFDDEPKMVIILETPIEMTDVSWPTTGVAKKIPKTKFDVGNITTNSTESFTIYVGDTSMEEFNAYVDKCMKKGFDHDYSRYDTIFYGKNKKNIEVTVSYEGNNVMRIHVYDWN